MFQHARPGDVALFGHMPHQEHRHPAAFGQLAQAVGALPHLGDAPGGGGQLLHVRRLDRVHDQHLRLDLGHMLEDRAQVGFRHQIQVLRSQPQPVGPHFDLARRFLAGDIQHRSGAVRQQRRRLKEQGGLAHAGIATDQDHAARHDPPAQHAGELLDGQRQAHAGIRADLAQLLRAGLHRRAGPGGCPLGGGRFQHFGHRVKFATAGAAAHVAGRFAATFLANVFGA